MNAVDLLDIRHEASGSAPDHTAAGDIGAPATGFEVHQGQVDASLPMHQVAAADAEATSPAPAAANAKKWHDTYKRVRDMLAVRYPTIFSCARPLKVGIDRDLRAAISGDELSNVDRGISSTSG